MSTHRIRIAIDGPAASGKGTVARAVARALGYRYLDTGAMYRAVALKARELGCDWSDQTATGEVAEGLDLDFAWDGDQARVILGGRDISQAIRTADIGEGASAVAVHPRVRAAMVSLQRHLAAQGGVVVDGRDIGTVVLPAAELKIFLDASLDERARRRWQELLDRGQEAELSRVTAALAARDQQDSSRAVGPLKAADDAVRLDSTRLSPEQVVARVLRLALTRGAVMPSARPCRDTAPA